ncbi:MAG: ADP-ribosylglycohydrolase family protein [Myxococcaceae bacterium]|nr:ADP-ribosylglycohydrolase family protein [Myxococcaceae bacterium]
MTPSERLSLAWRSLDGLSVGDALGEQFFGPERTVLDRIERREVPAGRWPYTDDTEMALGIVEVLAERGVVDQELLADVFARRFRANRHRGYGGTAQTILEAIGDKAPWQQVSRRVFGGEGSQGNGAAMRAAPVGAYFFDDDEQVIVQARRSAEVTHAHPDGQAGAIAVALAAAFVTRDPGMRDGDELLRWVAERTPPGPTRDGLERARELPLHGPLFRAIALGTGQNVISSDTVPFALFCAARCLTDYEAALWTTVAGLGDRDTTCAIVGSIVAMNRQATIPRGWLEAREVLGRTSAW